VEVYVAGGLFKYSQCFKGFKHSAVKCGISLLFFLSLPFYPLSSPQNYKTFMALVTM